MVELDDDFFLNYKEPRRRIDSGYPLHKLTDLESELDFLNGLLSSPPTFSPRTLVEIRAALKICNSPFRMTQLAIQKERVWRLLSLIKRHIEEDKAFAKEIQTLQALFFKDLLIRYGDYFGECIQRYREYVANSGFKPAWGAKMTTTIENELEQEEIALYKWETESFLKPSAEVVWATRPETPRIDQVKQIAVGMNEEYRTIRDNIKNYSERNTAVHHAGISSLIRAKNWMMLGAQMEHDRKLLEEIVLTHPKFYDLKTEILQAFEICSKRYKGHIEPMVYGQKPITTTYVAPKENDPLTKDNAEPKAEENDPLNMDNAELKAEKEAQQKQRKEKALDLLQHKAQTGTLDEAKLKIWTDLRKKDEDTKKGKKECRILEKRLQKELKEHKMKLTEWTEKVETKETEWTDSQKELKKYRDDLDEIDAKIGELALDVLAEEEA